ncbi:MAG: hypothetical protein MUF34_30320 [Polyangiaceae bacterium]|nr:hypothetical protein [Polyangiaceae bacterium]
MKTTSSVPSFLKRALTSASGPAGLLFALATAACGGGGDNGTDVDPTLPGGSGGSLPQAGQGGSPGPGGPAGAGTGGLGGAGGPGAGSAGAIAGGGGSGGLGGPSGAGAGGEAGAGASGLGGEGGVGGASGAGAGGSPQPPDPLWFECQASDQAFVRRAYQAVLGRRPSGQAEVNYYTDVLHAIDAAENVDPAIPYNPQVPRPSRGAFVDVLAAGRSAEYLSRWTEVYLDALRVQRVDELANEGCFDQVQHPNPSVLPELVRDGDPKATGASSPFTMLDLTRGALLVDDVTAPYIGNLFAMLVRTYSGANATAIELELSRRSDFGAWFNAAYLHRDVVCLSCHNSEFSVTQTGDPATNRHFPIPALLEKSLYGNSMGPPSKDSYDGWTRAWGVLRYDNFVSEGVEAQRPWKWSGECGSFNPNPNDDIAGVDVQFAGLSGKRVTAFDTARVLQQGFRELREQGLVVDEGGNVASPAMSFAYLVSMNIVENAWREIVGTPLTIPLYFPRNAAARDELRRLTDSFVAGGFSNLALLRAIVTSPAFNLSGPEDACWKKPYPAPALFDPWTFGEPDELRRGNGPSDAVAPLSSRVIARSLSAALDWPNPLPSFPQTLFQQQVSPEIGLFLHNSATGFRGFDFQARLSWELAFGVCDNPGSGPTVDFIDDLRAQANALPGASARDLVVALKDRLIGEPSIDEGTERFALEALLGSGLDDTLASAVEPAKLRALCGALVSTPQMLLSGATPRDTTDVPALTPPKGLYGAFCNDFNGDTLGDYRFGCANNKVTVERLTKLARLSKP